MAESLSCGLRWRATCAAQRVQSLQDAVTGFDSDALLLIGGVDSRHDERSAEVLGWLLAALSGREIFGGGDPKVRLLLEEAVVVVAVDEVRMYATRELYSEILPHIGLMQRLRLWVPPENILGDVEAMEEHKARSFVQMMDGLSTLAVPLAAAALGSGAATALEKWPLVQAFALQEFADIGGGRFFTACKKFRGVGDELQLLLREVDAAALRWLATSEAPRLSATWASAETEIEAAVMRTHNLPKAYSEAVLGEPVLSYYEHGMLRASQLKQLLTQGEQAPRMAHARLLLGLRTALVDTNEVSSAAPSETVGCERDPRHLTLESCEPLGPLYAARTLFLGTGIEPLPLAPEIPPESIVEEENSVETGGVPAAAESASPLRRRGPARAAAAAKTLASADSRAEDVKLLQGLYGALCAALANAVKSEAAGSHAPSTAGILSAASAALTAHVRTARLPLPADWTPALTAAVQIVDMLGIARTDDAALQLATEGGLLWTVRVGLKVHGADGIYEQTADSPLLGCLLVADTFASDGAGGIVCMTELMPRWGCWRAAGNEARAAAELFAECESLSSRLQDRQHAKTLSAMGDGAAAPLALEGSEAPHTALGSIVAQPLEGCALLIHGAPSVPVLHGDVFALSRGLVLRHKRLGAIAVRFASSKSAPKRAVLLEPPPMHAALRDEAASPPLLLSFAIPTAELPAVLGATANFVLSAGARSPEQTTELVLAVFSPAARRTFVREVLPAWRAAWSESSIPYMASEHGASPDGPPRSSELEHSIAPRWPTDEVASAFETRALAGRFVPSPQPSTSPSIPALVLAGMPGAGVQSIANGIVSTTAGEVRWLHVPAASWTGGQAGGGAVVDPTVLRAALAAALSPLKDPSAEKDERPVQMIIEASGFTPLPAMLSAIKSAFASLAAGGVPQAHIGFVVTCVDAPRALELEDAQGNGRASPGVLEQCAAGFAQAILVSETDAVSEERLAYLSALLSAANPLAQVTRTPYGARAAASLVSSGLTTTGGGGAPFDAKAQQSARALVAKDWLEHPNLKSAAHVAGLYIFTLPPPPPVSLTKLIAALRLWMCDTERANKPISANPAGELVLLEGVVATAPPETKATSGTTQLNLSRSAFWPPKDVDGAQSVATPLYCVGRGQGSRSSLAQLLLDCRPLPLKEEEATLPVAEREELVKRLAERPLPEGWLYTGRDYVDVDGNRSTDHPSLAAAEASAKAALNEEIARRNAVTDDKLAFAEKEAVAYLAQLKL